MNVEKQSCDACHKTVYVSEKLTADGHVYHKTCFRCTHCNNILKLGSYASMDGVFYCKPHFKQLFATKGNYSEGFGKLKPQQQFNQKQGRETSAPQPVSTGAPSQTTSNGTSATTSVSSTGNEQSSKETTKESTEDVVPKGGVAAMLKKHESAVNVANSPPPPSANKAAEEIANQVDSQLKVSDDQSTTNTSVESKEQQKVEEPTKTSEEKAEGGNGEETKETNSSSPSVTSAKKTYDELIGKSNNSERSASPSSPKPVASETRAASTTNAGETRAASTTNATETRAASSTKSSSPAVKKATTTGTTRGTSNKCKVCEKTVYPMEECRAEDVVYHKTCFRCTHCNNIVKLGNYACMGGVVYCKPHFKQLFATKGNYSEAFGKLKPQQEFEASKAAAQQ